MRRLYWPAFLILTSGLLLLGPTPGLTQFPGSPEDGPGRRDGSDRRGGFDRRRMFDRMPGRDGPGGAPPSREQFLEMMRERMASMRRDGGGPPGFPPSGLPLPPGMTPPPGMPTLPGLSSPPAPPSGGSPANGPGPGGPDYSSRDDSRSEYMFRRSDRNNDGVLSTEEMSDTLKTEAGRWDSNRNGVVEQDEYRDYYRARMTFLRGDSTPRPSPDFPGSERSSRTDPQPPPPEEKKPSVYHLGNLPKDLPRWYSPMDRDQDAQVALYEWKSEGKSTEEFRKYDANADGFITVDEILRYQKQEEEEKKAASQVASRTILPSSYRTEGDEPAPSFGGSGPGFGARPPFGGLGTPPGGSPPFGGRPPFGRFAPPSGDTGSRPSFDRGSFPFPPRDGGDGGRFPRFRRR